jgi:hypothetical protein
MFLYSNAQSLNHPSVFQFLHMHNLDKHLNLNDTNPANSSLDSLRHLLSSPHLISPHLTSTRRLGWLFLAPSSWLLAPPCRETTLKQEVRSKKEEGRSKKAGGSDEKSREQEQTIIYLDRVDREGSRHIIECADEYRMNIHWRSKQDTRVGKMRLHNYNSRKLIRDGSSFPNEKWMNEWNVSMWIWVVNDTSLNIGKCWRWIEYYECNWWDDYFDIEQSGWRTRQVGGQHLQTSKLKVKSKDVNVWWSDELGDKVIKMDGRGVPRSIWELLTHKNAQIQVPATATIMSVIYLIIERWTGQRVIW